MQRSIEAGFTLIELMITVAIIAILAGVAFPAYTSYIVRSNRAAALTMVMGVANRQEQYKIDARSYSNQLSQLGYATTPNDVAANYQVTVTADNTVAPPIYLITATPIGNQLARDTMCGTLTLDQTGTRTFSGAGPIEKCW